MTDSEAALLKVHQRRGHTGSWRALTLCVCVQRWVSEGVVFVVPRGELDDLFWMYATVLELQGQEEGGLMRAVSNDCLRDHWVGLLEGRVFQRWRASQVSSFHFNYKDDGTPQNVTLR